VILLFPAAIFPAAIFPVTLAGPLLAGGTLPVITSAVTPAVMISASAILVGGVSAKHSSMSDRVRDLAAEYRLESTTQARRDNIVKQCAFFRRRLELVADSHMLLYGATGMFCVMVLIISLSSVYPRAEIALFPLFLVGVIMLLASSLFEILEVHLGNRILLLDAEEAFVHTK
jgi:hypothetical protein